MFIFSTPWSAICAHVGVFFTLDVRAGQWGDIVIESMLVEEMLRPSGGHRCSTSLGLPLLHVLVAGWEADIGGSFYWSSVRMLPGLPCLVNV